ncbi:hypothetical protein AAFC00_001341 [Neodothiora populina]|uniref:PCI domain-containing protein n=1 Tax=Neodothiora populina TaxID=2781224 RepID=A0ABR3PPL6_9PEZI
MAGVVEQSAHFTDRRTKGLPVADAPKFDLESYATNYDLHTRILRLRHIAQICPPLALEALHLAFAAVKNTKDTALYLSLATLLRNVDPSDPLATPQLDWVERTNKLNEQETDRLEHELRGYKNNLIKESIRMGQEDLGTHYLNMANFDAAAKAYQKMREFCTTPKHIAEMTTKLIYINLISHQWLHALSNCQKLRALSLRPEDKARFDPIAQVASALANMGQGNYRMAAVTFIAVDPSYITLGPVAGVDFATSVMTGNDVAVYAALCALASMDRQELQSLVLDDSRFRNFLELEPHVRRSISLFCAGKYTHTLAILDSYRNDYLLDLFLTSHLDSLYQMIRSKSIVQYFVPFSSVTLSALATAFPPSAAPSASATSGSIEDELVDMIHRRQLHARIDSVNGILEPPPKDSREDAHQAVMNTADDIEHQLRLKLHRINMMQAGLEIQAPKSGKGKSAWAQGNPALSMA